MILFLVKHVLRRVLPMVFILLSGCAKLIEVPAPKTEMTPQTVFSGDVTAIAAMNAVYAQMSSQQLSYRMSLLLGLSSDELRNYSAETDYDEFESNRLSPRNSLVAELWREFYKYIYEANAVIEGVDNNNKISDSARKMLVGQASFIRAFSYFYLSNLFGDVPLVLTTDVGAHVNATRTSVDSVYQQINSDLTVAEKQLLPFSRSASRYPVVPSRQSSMAMLARVALFRGDWQSAYDYAAKTIVENAQRLSGDLADVFGVKSTEAIWQLAPVLPGANSSEAPNFLFIGRPTTTAITDALLASFENQDERKRTWIGEAYDDKDTFFFPEKYKVVRDTGDSKEYSVVIRLSELYLIRAEAAIHLGNDAEAVNDLHAIRERAHLPDVRVAWQHHMLEMVARERRSELFTEWGHRWLDVNRTRTASSVLSGKPGGWRSGAGLFPIPQDEINNDPSLVQNPGY